MTHHEIFNSSWWVREGKHQHHLSFLTIIYIAPTLIFWSHSIIYNTIRWRWNLCIIILCWYMWLYLLLLFLISFHWICIVLNLFFYFVLLKNINTQYLVYIYERFIFSLLAHGRACIQPIACRSPIKSYGAAPFGNALQWTQSISLNAPLKLQDLVEDLERGVGNSHLGWYHYPNSTWGI